jgi:hypothetical protein
MAFDSTLQTPEATDEASLDIGSVWVVDFCAGHE